MASGVGVVLSPRNAAPSGGIDAAAGRLGEAAIPDGDADEEEDEEPEPEPGNCAISRGAAAHPASASEAARAIPSRAGAVGRCR